MFPQFRGHLNREKEMLLHVYTDFGNDQRVSNTRKDFIASPIVLSPKYELSQCSVGARWQPSVSCAYSGEDKPQFSYI